MTPLIALALAFAALEEPRAAARTVAIAPGFELSGLRVLDADGDGRAELLALAIDGRVRTFAPRDSARAEGAPRDPARAVEPRGALTLPHPTRTLLAAARFGEKSYLVTTSPAGTVAYAVGAEGEVASTGAAWIPRARFTLRVPGPTFSSIVQDVNSDGTADVVIPTLAGCEIWLGTLASEAEAPTFRKAATVAVRIRRSGSHEARLMSDGLESSFSIPDLDTRDVNGDGRPDLLVEQDTRRAFHLQREDGSFPVEADVEVDLSIFRDTSEKAEFQFGGTLTAGDRATYESRDLDQDEIPDYVIAHRRKVWVFRGTRAGPQFKDPSAILKTADDVTALLVINLDGDARPDLLLIKVTLPTLATLLRGLFGEWDVQIQVLGYRNKGDGSFESEPTQKNELSIRLPAIVGLLKNPERIVERFEALGKRFRKHAEGDLDGDGNEDALLATEDSAKLEIWLGRAGEEHGAEAGEAELRAILFDDANRVWDIDRVLLTLGDLAQRRVAMQTGGRPLDRAIELRVPSNFELATLECADVDGDGKDEIVVGYEELADRRNATFDVHWIDGARAK